MKTKTKSILILAAIFGSASLTTLFGQAGQGSVFSLSGDVNEWSDEATEGAINQIISLVFYLMYAAGAIFMGIGAFKLKSGDVQGFAKNFLGGAALFCSPLVVNALTALGDNI